MGQFSALANGDSFLLGYTLSTYNLSFYESGTRNFQCYLWGECDGKRGANDICTGIYKYLQSVDSQNANIKEMILYCDSCSGRNKNHQILAMFNCFLKSSNNIFIITIKYLLPGHTNIELAHKNKVIYAPSEWDSIIRNARYNGLPCDM